MAFSVSPTPLQQQRLDEARRVARKWVAPRAAGIGGKNEVPRGLLRREQRRRPLPTISLGKRFPCFALTERQAGDGAARVMGAAGDDP
ncbi:MAG: hypothetical protein QXO51_06885 [Halobacteria archaeon]